MGFRLTGTSVRLYPLSGRALVIGGAALSALILAGCETASGIRPAGRGIAEISDTDSKSATANIEFAHRGHQAQSQQRRGL